MGSEALQVGKVYRHLLKAVKNHIGKEEYKRHFRDFITQEFRKNGQVSESEISSIQHRIKVARDYTFLLNSVHHHKDQSSGKRIGNASEHEGLYYFDEGTDEIKQVHTVSWEPSSRQNQVMLWHFRTCCLLTTLLWIDQKK